MLVVGMEATFSKKATGITRFHCRDGYAISETIGQAIATGEGQTVKVRSTGVNAAGETIADFFITWSFKAKSKATKNP
jgi:inosine-uridine nucleoside N-ribohydrolase